MSPVAFSASLLRKFRGVTTFSLAILALSLLSARAVAQCTLNQTDPSVTICAPANGATVTSPVNVVAGTHSSKTVSSIWVYLDTNSTPSYKASGVTSINTNITVPTGTHKIIVKAWNSAGTLFESSVTVTVTTGTSGPVASVSPSSLNFGSVAVGSTSPPQTVTLKNTGTATLNLTSIAASGDYAQSNVCGSSLSPGGSCTISVTFTPTAAGTRTGSLSISDNAPGSPQTVSLTGSGGSTSGPVASLSPTSLTFPSTAVGSSSAAQTVKLTNSGGSALSITSIATSGDYGQSNNCGSSLAAGANCSINVTFSPTATGTRSGTLTVSDNAAGSPQTASLTGSGGSSGTCTASTVNPSVTICTPANGATVTSPVHIVAETTSTTYHTTAIWVYVDNVVQYKSASNATSIDTNIAMSAGTHSVNVQAWNSAGQVFKSVISITVSGGTGGGTVQLTPSSLTFPSTAVGSSSAAQSVSLSNGSSSALSITSIAASGDFSQTNNCGASVAAGASCAISVTFQPTASGTRTGTLTVTDNASNSPQTASLTGTGGSGGGGGPIPINHFVVMIQENRSFDQYLSNLNNYRAARGYSTGVDVASPNATQPQDSGTYISRFHMKTMCIEELSPDWLESHGDANRWNPSSNTILMDGFVHTAQGYANYAGLFDKGGYRAMGYYTETDLPYYYFMATQFATSDRWFSPVPTNSTVNRLYGFAATSAGHVHDESYTLSNKTIFQALQDTGHTWKLYYTDVDSSGVPASRIWRFQPFANNNKSHIVPISQYFTDVKNGTLPDFAFIETGFLSGRDEHPGGTVAGNPTSGNQIQRGAAYAASLINALMSSPSWTDSAFILTWDEDGGLYDHVPPDMNVPNPDGIPPIDLRSGDPTGDFTRTGFRVPLLVVSPWTKPHYVSHTTMDYTAYLKLVETRFGLSALTGRDAAMPDMTEFFDFTNKPWATPPSPPAQQTSGECNYTDLP